MIVRLVAVVLGSAIVIMTYYWAMQVLMVKGAEPPLLARLVFRGVRIGMYAAGLLVGGQKRRQQVWALYVPVSLLAIIFVSVAEILIGYTLIFYGVSSDSMRTSYINSVSSLSVLGFGGLPAPLLQATIALAEAFTGPIFVALLITNLANMYSTLNQEKARLRAMEVQVGRGRSGPDLLVGAISGPGLAALSDVWSDWAVEFDRLARNYDTVEGYLMIFAPTMQNPWASDAVTVLDAANLRNSTLDLPDDPQATRCLTEGTAALHQTSTHLQVHGLLGPLRHHGPHTVTRAQFDDACATLAAAQAPVVADRDAAWQAFSAQRKTYEDSAAHLCQLMHASPPGWP